MDHVSGIYLVTSVEAANCPSFVFNLVFQTSCDNIDINTLQEGGGDLSVLPVQNNKMTKHETVEAKLSNFSLISFSAFSFNKYKQLKSKQDVALFIDTQ